MHRLKLMKELRLVPGTVAVAYIADLGFLQHFILIVIKTSLGSRLSIAETSSAPHPSHPSTQWYSAVHSADYVDTTTSTSVHLGWFRTGRKTWKSLCLATVWSMLRSKRTSPMHFCILNAGAAKEQPNNQNETYSNCQCVSLYEFLFENL